MTNDTLLVKEYWIILGSTQRMYEAIYRRKAFLQNPIMQKHKETAEYSGSLHFSDKCRKLNSSRGMVFDVAIKCLSKKIKDKSLTRFTFTNPILCLASHKNLSLVVGVSNQLILCKLVKYHQLLLINEIVFTKGCFKYQNLLYYLPFFFCYMQVALSDFEGNPFFVE